MTNAIEAAGLVKTFGRTRALDGLDLAVAEGEVHGFLGPNGAGKSTTIRVLLGLLRATGGRATVLGRDPWRDAVAIHRDIAYVPGDVALWPNLSGGETIDLLTGLRGGADPALRARLLRDFELDPRTKSRGYSKGNRQKVALVAAFARPARLYILDEPTSGLDPVMESVFQAEVRRIAAEGRPSCSRATSSARSSSCASASRSSAPGGRWSPAPSPTCATSRARASASRPRRRPPTSRTSTACTT